MDPRRSRGALVALIALVVVGGALIGAFTFGGLGRSEPTPTPSPSPTASPSPTPSPSPTASPSPSPSPSPEATCPMNGEPLEDPSLAQRPAIQVQIENNPEARPPWGLNLADLVVEAPVEGNTTRFAVVFLCRETVGEAIGTVRSLRYFNVDLFQQMHTVTFNFGGAPAVRRRLDENDVPYVNGLTSGWPFFFRGGPLGAPHNVFFDVDAARAELESGGLTELAERAGTPRGPFVFAPDADIPAGRDVSGITIATADFWSFGWEWDAGSGRWLRIDAGAPNSDRITGERLQARTVVVQLVEQEVLPGELDPGGYPRRYQFLTGEGTGTMFVNGQAHDIRWSRENAEDVTTWTYANGEPMVLPPGRVWWEIVPVGSGIDER